MNEPVPAPDPDDGVAGGTHLFFALCSALVVAFIAWSHFGKLDVVSTAMGEVIPSTQIKSVQHLEGGIVREILVREGDDVKRGQPLVSLEPVASGADVRELDVRITALRTEVARLEAEAEGLDTPVFPDDIRRAHPELVGQAQAYFDTRRSRMENQIASQRDQIEQLRRQTEEITARLKNSRRQLTFLNEQIGISNELLKDKLTNRLQHLDLLKEASALEGRIGEDTAAISQNRAAIKGARNKLAATQDAFREKAREELEKKRRELDEISNRRRKYEDSLKRTVLRSPVDGVVKTLYVVTIGGVVAPGGTVVDVVPGGDRLIIEAQLPTQDIGYVQPGQKAQVTLASSDAVRFGHIEGRVVGVSPDAIEAPGGGAYYKVRITTERDHFERQGVKYRLVPGVRVMSSIRTGQRSVLAYITDPFLGSVQTALRER